MKFLTGTHHFGFQGMISLRFAHFADHQMVISSFGCSPSVEVCNRSVEARLLSAKLSGTRCDETRLDMIRREKTRIDNELTLKETESDSRSCTDTARASTGLCNSPGRRRSDLWVWPSGRRRQQNICCGSWAALDHRQWCNKLQIASTKLAPTEDG